MTSSPSVIPYKSLTARRNTVPRTTKAGQDQGHLVRGDREALRDIGRGMTISLGCKETATVWLLDMPTL